jgi:hypothetical protein
MWYTFSDCIEHIGHKSSFIILHFNNFSLVKITLWNSLYATSLISLCKKDKLRTHCSDIQIRKYV